MDPVNICFCGDKHVIPLFTVAVSSLIDNLSKDRKYNIYFLHDSNCSDEELENIKKLGVILINMKEYEPLFEGIDTRRYHRASLYRLVLPDVFPKLNKILYCDVDVMFRSDPSELYDLKDDKDMNWYIMARKNFKIINTLYRVFRKDDSVEYNSGILLINLRAWRLNSISQKLIHELQDVKYKLPDQTALNNICEGHILELPLKWNCYPINIPFYDAGIIHFQMNSIKYLPSISKYKKEWFMYANKSGVEFEKDYFKTEIGNTICVAVILILLFVIFFLMYKLFYKNKLTTPNMLLNNNIHQIIS